MVPAGVWWWASGGSTSDERPGQTAQPWDRPATAWTTHDHHGGVPACPTSREIRLAVHALSGKVVLVFLVDRAPVHHADAGQRRGRPDFQLLPNAGRRRVLRRPGICCCCIAMQLHRRNGLRTIIDDYSRKDTT